MRLLLAQVKQRSEGHPCSTPMGTLVRMAAVVGMTDLAAMTAELLRLEGARRRCEARSGPVDRPRSSPRKRSGPMGMARWRPGWPRSAIGLRARSAPGFVLLASAGARRKFSTPSTMDSSERLKLASSVDCGPTHGPGTTSPTRSGCSSNRRPSSASRTSEWCVVGGRPWLTRMAPIAITHVPTTRRQASTAFVGGRFHLEATGDHLAGAVMSEILERFEQAQFHAEWDQLRERLGDSALSGAARAHPGPAPLRRVADHLHHGRYRSGCASSG